MNKSGNADDPSLYYIETFFTLRKNFTLILIQTLTECTQMRNALQGLKGECLESEVIYERI